MKNLHFVGVLGVSNSGLAKYLLERGFSVSGSDLQGGDKAKELIDKGLVFYNKHRSKNVRGADAVVYTSAAAKDNPEIKYALCKKIPLIKRSELLGGILSDYKKSIAVSGSHGKTTATAMISDVLISAGVDPTVFIGGEHKSFGTFRSGKSEYAVAEACEYKKNFLDIKPYISVVLNVDNDHLDCYKNMDEMLLAFKGFTKGNLSLINVDDKYASKICGEASVTFGIDKSANYTAKNVKYNGQGFSFTACAYSQPLGRINLKVIGRHNVYNALSAVAVAHMLKINFKSIKSALESFIGVRRRAEYLGSYQNVKYFADYAHHPKEIEETLKAFSQTEKSLGVIFQPHTYSRTERLMSDFALALKDYQTVIYKTYAARERFNKKGCAYQLYKNLALTNVKGVYYAQNQVDLQKNLQKLTVQNKTIIFLGAGDIYDCAKTILESIKNNLQNPR